MPRDKSKELYLEFLTKVIGDQGKPFDFGVTSNLGDTYYDEFLGLTAIQFSLIYDICAPHLTSTST